MSAHAPRRAHVASHLDRRFVSVQQYAAQVRPDATAHRDTRAPLGPARSDPPTDQVLGPGRPRRRSPRVATREDRRDPRRKLCAVGARRRPASHRDLRTHEPRAPLRWTDCGAMSRRCANGRRSGCRCARRCADRTRPDAAASDARTPRCSTAVGVCWRLAGTRDHQAHRSGTAPAEIWSQTVSRARWGGSVPAIARPRR